MPSEKGITSSKKKGTCTLDISTLSSHLLPRRKAVNRPLFLFLNVLFLLLVCLTSSLLTIHIYFFHGKLIRVFPLPGNHFAAKEQEEKLKKLLNSGKVFLAETTATTIHLPKATGYQSHYTKNEFTFSIPFPENPAVSIFSCKIAPANLKKFYEKMPDYLKFGNFGFNLLEATREALLDPRKLVFLKNLGMIYRGFDRVESWTRIENDNIKGFFCLSKESSRYEWLEMLVFNKQGKCYHLSLHGNLQKLAIDSFLPLISSFALS